MKNQQTNENVKNWTRVAAWLGVLLTEPKVRARIAQSLKDRADSFTDKTSDKYHEAMHRMEIATDALRGKSSRAPQIVGFVAGLGIGAGLGVLLAPAPGSETRNAVREKAASAGNKIVNSASMAAGSFSRSTRGLTTTGTEG